MAATLSHTRMELLLLHSVLKTQKMELIRGLLLLANPIMLFALIIHPI